MYPKLSEREIKDLSKRLGESEELLSFRQQALRLVADVPPPDRVQHLWKYTDPEVFLSGFELSKVFGESSKVGWNTKANSGAQLVSGSAPVVRLSPDALHAGVRLLPFAKTPGVLDFLGKAVPAEHGIFELINAAAFDSSVVLHVPAGVTLTEPIVIESHLGLSLQIPRILILLEADAEATVIESYSGGKEGALLLGVSEAFVGPNSRLRYLVHENWNDGVRAHRTLRINQKRDSDVFTALASLGGGRTKSDLGSVLQGEGARSEMIGLGLGAESRSLDQHTVHLHQAQHTWSNLDFRVALNGKAQSAYTGLIRIDDNAGASEAYQENRNLLLSRQSRADTIPELEILTEDVRCTHGATVSPIDDEQLFYLKSRGLNERQAENLIVRGFFDKILDRLPEHFKSYLEDSVSKRLQGLVGEKPYAA